MLYLLLFLAGALAGNAIPHLAAGLRGERFFTPWARPRGTGRSSPLENFLWGAANFLIAVWLLTRSWGDQVPHGLWAAAAGFVFVGIFNAVWFGRRVANGA